jgi:hypothetical protein
VEQDQRLEQSMSSASEELARHRWHWTLDPDNPKRVSIREYARAVGRNVKTIRCQVNGYVAWAEGGTALTLNEAIERAKFSEEKAELMEAVAEANEVGIQQARKVYAPDVSRLREAVNREAERRPEMTAEERRDFINRTADFMSRSRRAEKRRQEHRKSNRTAQFVIIDGEITQARRCLMRALTEARGTEDLDQDTVRLLETALDSLKAITELLRLAISGSIAVDWDAELARLGDN